MGISLRYCTLTGADSRTVVRQLVALSQRYPFVEWGLLWSPTRAGKEPRYAPMNWLRYAAKRLEAAGANMALHVCGRGVGDLVDDTQPALWALAERFGRVQLNLRASRYTADQIARVGERLARNARQTRVIVQMNRGNASLCETLARHESFEFLFDASGGRGIERANWPRLGADADHGLGLAPCGYAGGLGPDNIGTQLVRMARAAGGVPFWVDMEGKLRDETDWFVVARAETVLAEVERCLRQPVSAD